MVGRNRNAVDTTSFAGLVGHNIRRVREKRRISVDDAAVLAGIDRSTWYRLEQGQRPSTTGKSIEVVASTLRVPITELLRKPRA